MATDDVEPMARVTELTPAALNGGGIGKAPSLTKVSAIVFDPEAWVGSDNPTADLKVFGELAAQMNTFG